MIEQLKTIRDNLGKFATGYIDAGNKIVDALTQLEAMVGEQEPVAKLHDDGYWTPMKTEAGRALNDRLMRAGSPSIEVYTAAPVAQQPQAETDNHEAQGQLEFLDKKNNALSAAIRKVMARLADLLDEDQFKEIEEIVSFAGVQPQAEEVPLTHVLVPVDEPTDEMVDAACAAVDGLCRVDFVRAYAAAFAHLKAGYRDESYWCGWNAAIKFQQAEAVPVVDRVYEAAKRLVDHADFQLGGVLSAKSKARDIPSNAASKVKARHLASLRDALAKTPQQAEAVPPGYVLVPVEPTPETLHAVRFAGDPDRPAIGERIVLGETAYPFVGADVALCMYRTIVNAAIAQQKGPQP